MNEPNVTLLSPTALPSSAAGYDDLGRRTGLSRGNGTSSSYSFDAASRLTGLGVDLAGTTNDLTVTLGAYNPASQIGSRVKSNDAVYAFTNHYNVNRSYTNNGLNQATVAGDKTLSYDGRGNLASDGSYTYAYDVDNHLVAVTGNASLTLAYDPVGRLAQTAGGVTTNFLYDGDDLVGEYDGSGTLLRRYVHGDGDDEPLVWYEGAGLTDRRWLSADERGSIIAVTDGAGNASNTYAYDAYGIGPKNFSSRFGYTGQVYIPEVQLYHYKARTYSATLGRFLQTDPIGYDAGMNMYAYVSGDPVNATDPSGLAETIPPELVLTAPRSLIALSGYPGALFAPTPRFTQITDQQIDPTITDAGKTHKKSKPQKTPAPSRARQAYCAAKVYGGIGLDVAGTIASLIPGESQALTLTQLGLSSASFIYSGVTHNVGGLVTSGAGYAVTTGGLLATSQVAAKLIIPGAGAALGAYQTYQDAKTSDADYSNCLAGK